MNFLDKFRYTYDDLNELGIVQNNKNDTKNFNNQNLRNLLSSSVKVSENLFPKIANSIENVFKRLDLKNNFSPFYDIFGLELYDECSRLNIKYSNRRYNDNFNTSPEELISISYYMDYLGFFGYQQTTDLFFQEAGTFNYGL